MADVHSKKVRSYNMARIKGKNTAPELFLRKSLWKAGLRGYRLHYPVSGRPDIVFPKKKLAIFVDGDFWHKNPMIYREPKTHSGFWRKKLAENVKRDKKVNLVLKKTGWKVIRIWESALKKEPEKYVNQISSCLN